MMEEKRKYDGFCSQLFNSWMMADGIFLQKKNARKASSDQPEKMSFSAENAHKDAPTYKEQNL